MNGITLTSIGACSTIAASRAVFRGALVATAVSFTPSGAQISFTTVILKCSCLYFRDQTCRKEEDDTDGPHCTDTCRV